MLYLWSFPIFPSDGNVMLLECWRKFRFLWMRFLKSSGSGWLPQHSAPAASQCKCPWQQPQAMAFSDGCHGTIPAVSGTSGKGLPRSCCTASPEEHLPRCPAGNDNRRYPAGTLFGQYSCISYRADRESLTNTAEKPLGILYLAGDTHRQMSKFKTQKRIGTFTCFSVRKKVHF